MQATAKGASNHDLDASCTHDVAVVSVVNVLLALGSVMPSQIVTYASSLAASL